MILLTFKFELLFNIVVPIRAVLWTYIKTVSTLQLYVMLDRRRTTINFLLHPSVYTTKLIEILVGSFVEEIGHEILLWIYLVKVRDHGRRFWWRICSCLIKGNTFLHSWTTVRLWRRTQLLAVDLVAETCECKDVTTRHSSGPPPSLYVCLWNASNKIFLNSLGFVQYNEQFSKP
jgi:hypothetical protein